MPAPVLHRSAAAGPPPPPLRVQPAAGGRRARISACPSRHTAAPCSAVAVHAAKGAGSAGEPESSHDAVQQRLQELDAEAKGMAAKVESAYAKLEKALEAANPNLKVIDTLQKRYDDLVAEKARLDIMRQDMQAKLPGARALPRPAALVPVLRRQIVPDLQDPNVLLLRDAISHEPVKNQFVIDPMVRLEGQVMRATKVLEQYVVQAHEKFSKGVRQTPLLVSGPIKSGKSYTAEELLPAVVHSTFEFDYGSAGNVADLSPPSHPTTTTVTLSANAPTTCPTTATSATIATLSTASVPPSTAPKPPPPIFLHVNCLDISKDQGVAGFYRELLDSLKSAAQKQGLPAAAAPAAADGASRKEALNALLGFYERLPRDRLTYVTLDEAQSFFLLVRPSQQGAAGLQRTQWDQNEIEHMRRSFKTLVTTAPCHVAMVITGSTMAAVWANFAHTPSNGLALISHNVALHLPGYSDADVMRSTWQQLQQEYKQLPAALRAQSLPGYALLIWLVKVWVDGGRPWVNNTYVLRTYQYKLFPEVVADLTVVEETLAAIGPEGAAAFAKNLLNLLDRSVGCEQGALLRTGMLAFMGNELQPVAGKPGHVWVESTVYKHMLQLVLSKDGKLQLGPFMKEPVIGDYARLMTLNSLGEVCGSARWSWRRPHNQPLQDLLQTLASSLKLSAKQIYTSKWYQHMLAQPACNYGGGGTSARDCIVGRWDAGGMSKADLMLEYCVCVRIVISHAGADYPWWLLLPDGCVPELLQLLQQDEVDCCLAALRTLNSSTATINSSSP